MVAVAVIALMGNVLLPVIVWLLALLRDICSKEAHVQTHMQRYVSPLAKAYLELYKSTTQVREFFGLRDFYR